MHIGGIIQGRLLPPVDGHIQEFPKDNWKEEFETIKELGMTHIEWIITKKSFEEGVLNLELSEYADRISSICCDNLIDKKFLNHDFLAEQLRPICNWAIDNGIKAIGIPLLEDSEINATNIIETIEVFKSYGNVYPDLEFHFETDCSPLISQRLVYSCDNFFFTYDTGNITSAGYVHNLYLMGLQDKIKNVHLKDRTTNPVATVAPGTGDTNFELIFDVLKKNDYNCIFTIQTARGESGKEKETIKRHKEFYEQFI
jgi:sugar phosphate isomerase/epimerase